VGKYKFDCSLGIAGLPDGRFLVARGSGSRAKGFTGSVVIADADKTAGLAVRDHGAGDEAGRR
jgi:hypothetical protein